MLNQEPDRALHSGTIDSIMNTKAIPQVPLAVMPNKNNITVVNKICFEKITPTLMGKSAT